MNIHDATEQAYNRGYEQGVNDCKAKIDRLEQNLKEAHLDIKEHIAEIERFAKEVDRLSQVVLYHDGQIADAQAEAIKEFAERVKAKHRRITEYDEAGFGCKTFVVYEETIDQIAKEMGVEL